jgi:hypothetical protein
MEQMPALHQLMAVQQWLHTDYAYLIAGSLHFGQNSVDAFDKLVHASVFGYRFNHAC